MAENPEPHASSFRDPSGYIFRQNNVIYRAILKPYFDTYQKINEANLYQILFDEALLIRHTEREKSPEKIILQPEKIDFISYPYEWSFSQWKEAALLTLRIQRRLLDFNFSLKDASAFNVQFHLGKPIFIDTLSLEPYVEGAPWIAYRQFCEHFLAPLALMALTDIRLSQLFRTSLQGIPLDLARTLLPWRSRLNPHLLAHLHLHATNQKRWANSAVDAAELPSSKISRTSLLGILESLESAITSLHWQPKGTEWGDYYDQTNYTDHALEAKRQLVSTLLDQVEPAPKMVWDCGANNGYFSRIASERGIFTVAWDIDPAAVEQNYRNVRGQGETHLLPLLQDLTNPSFDCGWNAQERQSLRSRGPADTVFALALIHHLAISNNVPLPQISAFFANLTPWLLIEFVPKEDSQVKRLLAHRQDIFPSYHEAGFEDAFREHWEEMGKVPIQGTSRTLYLLRQRAPQ